ncbi:uncharacterized protein HMPREF1541_02381 [Cyphellophora europaea CBS 101466]|uniref:DUF7514 domain-containing protein n=1 Tax=Cyphellophora europaea (strain CBS 101466) TaxID=1220924 RepID=W2S3F6_CYPE1|nr:uncharacterized protein HMPREF1541_02381 [Cyphellophora europaea CBS 101466]ETN43222.1 hypothetical protein HMPREF1541_02381 [Cyphellophora europaea CBS 101466]
MAYQDHFPPPDPKPDPRYLQPHTQTSFSSVGSMPDLDQVRSRDNPLAQDGYTSDSSRYSRARLPINEAVNSAFTNSAATASAISPEILQQLTSQITANVIQQLKVSNLSVPNASPNLNPETKSSTGGSPPLDRAAVYTPPSPFISTETQRSPGHSGLGVDMPNGASPPLAERRLSPPLSQHSQADEERNFRPKGPQRISTGGDMTVVEKIWGKLVDDLGAPTPRLGQFLRGIAMHLIQDYEPKDSLVVTPAKMQRYYEETKLGSESYPWKDIFDDRTSSISRMLRELDVQHHLIQERPNERPDIPCLTPQGFETWCTLLIKAHPEQEHQRLAKTALEFPISNPDNKSERFPKELSRRLFPKQSDSAVEAKLRKSISVHCNVNLSSRHNSVVQPEQNVDNEPRASNAGLNSNNGVPPTPRDLHASAENNPRGRPHSFSSSSATGGAVVSDGDDTPTPQPIERERKPYAAQPGGGKEYSNTQPPASASELKPPTADAAKLKRSASNRESRPRPDDNIKPRPPPISVQQQSANTATNSAPIEIPESRHRHRNSVYYKDPPSTNGGPRRARSPSASKDSKFSARYSEPQESFNTFPPVGSAPADFERERDKRYRDYEVQRERLAGDRYDAARMSAYDPRDRDRERGDVRPRGQSIASYGHAEDDYYRSSGGYPPPERARDNGPVGGTYGVSAGSYTAPPGPHYPPSSYREGR